MKKTILAMVLVAMLFGCANSDKLGEEEGKKEIINVGIVGNDKPITRALVSKMLALSNYSKDEMYALENKISFKDVDKDSWYSKYINAVHNIGDMSGTNENSFSPDDYLTLMQTQYLIDKYDKNKKIKINTKNKDKPISYALWCNIYLEIIKDKKIIQDEIIILATKENAKGLEKDYIVTDKGLFSFEGLDYNKYINKKIKVIRKGREIIAITEVLDIKPTLKRAIIQKIDKNKITIFIGGVYKTFKYENKNKNIDIPENNGLFDIKIDGDNIIEIFNYSEAIDGKLNKIDDNTIRIGNINYVLDKDFKVYKKDGDKVSFKDKKDLIIGENIASYYIKGNENKIYGAIINKEPSMNSIRIAINNDDNLNFDKISLYSESGLKVFVKGGEKILKNKELVVQNGSDFFIGENEIMIISPIDKNDKIMIKNIDNKNINRFYYNTLEICKKDNKYSIINEISIDTYTKGALAKNITYKNNEMLKAMAVIFRSYAISYIEENALQDIGANAIDGSGYIMIDNNLVNDDIEKAIEQTKGKIIVNGDSAIRGTYFAYGTGSTTNSGEAWASKKYYEYPTENKPYLVHIKDFEEEIYDDLSNDTNANIFFKTKDILSLEKNSDWFRWSGGIKKENIAKINKKIAEIYKDNIHFIKTLKNGEYIYSPIENVGDIKDIKIAKRGYGGNVMELEIVGSENSVKIYTDSIIRDIFDIDIIKNNKNEIVDNVYKLPSSNFVMDKVYDMENNLKEITFFGGGYGHNVGLSLYGANMLAKNGRSYEDILHYYYKNIEIHTIK